MKVIVKRAKPTPDDGPSITVWEERSKPVPEDGLGILVWEE